MPYGLTSIWAQRAGTSVLGKLREEWPLGQALEQFGSVATRVYPTADDNLVVVAAKPGHRHGLTAQMAQHTLHELMDSGAARKAGITSLPYLLREARAAGSGQDVCLSLELRDRNSHGERSQPDLVLDAMAWVDFPLSRIRFSSTSTAQLRHMQSIAPHAALALMTAPAGQGSERGEPFSRDSIRRAQDLLGDGLVAIHPELRTVTPDMIEAVHEAGLQLGTWVHGETNPAWSRKLAGATRQVVDRARQLDLPVVMATAYPKQTRALALQA